MLQPKPKILFATTNDHKIRLFKIAWLDKKLDQKFELVTLNDIQKNDLGYINEDSGSFTGDATLKAVQYAKAYNLPTISQDRGFVFLALNWPGTDSKKVFTLDETHEFKVGKWSETKDLYFERSKEVLAKIDGLDRKMQVIQGLCLAMPNGELIAQEFVLNGRANSKCKESVSGAGGMYDWFFVPDGLDHTISEFKTKKEQDNYVALKMYPITNKIVDFLYSKVA